VKNNSENNPIKKAVIYKWATFIYIYIYTHTHTHTHTNIYPPRSTLILQTGGRDVTYIDTPSLKHNCDVTQKRSSIITHENRWL
jgi:hypothetical protein